MYAWILYIYIYIWYVFSLYIYTRNYGKDVSPNPMGSLMDHLHFLTCQTGWPHFLRHRSIYCPKSTFQCCLWTIPRNKVVTIGWASNTIWKLLSKLHYNIWVAVGFVLRQIGLYFRSLLAQSKKCWRAKLLKSTIRWIGLLLEKSNMVTVSADRFGTMSVL